MSEQASTEDPALLVSHISESLPHTPTKLKRQRPRKTGKKFKIPVPAAGKLHTFYDHGTTRNPQGYPLYPNGDTVFVQQPHEDITNFGRIAYTHTQKVKGAKDGPWKTIWYACLSVLHCDDAFCAYAAPPPTGDGKAAEFIKENPVCPAVECSGTHLWTQCPHMVCQIDIQKQTGWGVLRHLGIHAHPWPASKKANPLAMLDLTRGGEKPKGRPFGLEDGAGQTITPPVIDIHPAFGNTGRLAYLRRKVLVEKGLIPEKESKGGGNRLIIDLMHWGNHGLRLISTLLLGANVHITFQSEWMVLHHWIPVQLTWMWGLEESHYRAHFTTLLKQIQLADLTYHERGLLAQQVVDFSTAQKKGFVLAYMDVFNELDPAKALGKLRGCHKHFCQSITRIKKNRNIVDASQLFERLALDLLEPNKPNGLSAHGSVYPWTIRPLKMKTPSTTFLKPQMVRSQCIANTTYYCISVKYGSSWESVVETMGRSEERTRRCPDENDGCPPDTTNALLLPKKLGRPVGSANVNRDPHSSYQSYSASSDPGKLNCCWETSVMESLYPTFSPPVDCGLQG
ncbi:uncharacterized protein MELLADRAFT_87905 [Melampsora larici-populina 98AG31]|uniref:GCM domain-containing protein n=1 Tax=Melampsora larici-populina (strain 98AG31 / pathotype 3-4-7) TaxID=747676 RepID=F4RPY3_MELLP|nr:uncharacterized protein MELLADRAFT_87905 [Melampsora larici-populina 98AG31]EGG05655.1 hypothetical protein MELLADRAFT_87905 [Melampsora larici-populina 98AG31]